MAVFRTLTAVEEVPKIGIEIAGPRIERVSW